MLKGFVDNAPSDVVPNEHSDVLVSMLQPYQINGWYKGQHKACFTMWESSVLPQRFVDWLKVYDQIIVPCDHNVALFSQHHGNVKKVPLGVDHQTWKSKRRPDNQRFRFHAGGSQWIRKGLDVVLEAFKRANLDAELHLKLNPEAHDMPSISLPDNVFVTRHWMTQEETVEFFNLADCYVSVTRGEGFGFMPLQAAAMGIPTIMNASSGQAEFSYLGSLVVPHSQVKSHYGGIWDQSDPDDVASAMRQMYESHAQYKTAAKNQAKDTQAWSWKKAAKKLVDVLPEGKLLASPEWHSADVCYFVEVHRKATVSINGREKTFEKNRQYVVTENYYQLLLNGGYIKIAEVQPQ